MKAHQLSLFNLYKIFPLSYLLANFLYYLILDVTIVDGIELDLLTASLTFIFN
jgi:hypothetical protein